MLIAIPAHSASSAFPDSIKVLYLKVPPNQFVFCHWQAVGAVKLEKKGRFPITCSVIFVFVGNYLFLPTPAASAHSALVKEP